MPLAILLILLYNCGTSFQIANFRGVNWADERDNYVDGLLLPSGLNSSMSLVENVNVANFIVKGFQTNLNTINTIRMPINNYTVLDPTWWAVYQSVINASLAKGINIILACWEGPVKVGRFSYIKSLIHTRTYKHTHSYIYIYIYIYIIYIYIYSHTQTHIPLPPY